MNHQGKIPTYMNRLMNLTKTALLCFCMISIGTQSETQTAKAQQISPVLTPEEQAYIYHDQLPSIGHGFNVYREFEGEAERLNEQPVFPAANGVEFQRQIGDLFDVVAEGYETSNPNEIFFRLRGDGFDRNILAFSFPDIAEALGLLYVDEDPVIGEPVIYRFEPLNSRGEPIDEVFEQEVVVEQVAVDPPENIQAERDGRELTVRWNYAEATLDPDDIIIRFDVFMRPAGEEHFEKISEESRLRLQDQTEYTYTYESGDFPARAEIVVEAIDVTGQNSVASEPIDIELIDTGKPPQILEVHSNVTGGGVDLTWSISPDPNVAGYHIDRVNVDTDQTERLTDELIDTSDPRFRDDTAEPDQYYHYYVIAVSEAGVESERGNPAVENILPVHYPDSPANLSAEVNEEERTIELEWDGIEQDEMFNSYVVLRRTYREGEERGSFSQVNSEQLTEERIVDEGIAGEGFTEGMFYEYGVVSSNIQGRRSDTVFTIKQMPMLTPPEPPTSIEADIRNGVRINVVWGASPSTAVTSYNVYRTTEAEDTTVTNMSRGRRYLSDRNVETGETYRYFITAVDSAGNESTPTRESEVFMRGDTAPASVRNVQAVETEEGVEVWWEPSNADELEGYIVKRADIASGRFEPLTEEPLDEERWTDEAGEAGMWYRVVAIDAYGNKSRPGSARQATQPE